MHVSYMVLSSIVVCFLYLFRLAYLHACSVAFVSYVMPCSCSYMPNTSSTMRNDNLQLAQYGYRVISVSYICACITLTHYPPACLL